MDKPSSNGIGEWVGVPHYNLNWTVYIYIYLFMYIYIYFFIYLCIYIYIHRINITSVKWWGCAKFKHEEILDSFAPCRRSWHTLGELDGSGETLAENVSKTLSKCLGILENKRRCWWWWMPNFRNIKVLNIIQKILPNHLNKCYHLKYEQRQLIWL